VRAHGGDLPQRPLDVLDGRGVGEDRAVGGAPGHGERLRAPDAARHRRHDDGRVVEPDVVQAHVVAVDRDLLPREQRADRAQHLLDQPHLRAREHADLLHPLAHPMADPGEQAPGVQAREARELHRQEHRAAHRRGDDPDPDADPRGRRQRRAGGRDAAGEEAVLPQPQLVEPGGLDLPRESGQLLRRMLGADDVAEGRHGPASCQEPLPGSRRGQVAHGGNVHGHSAPGGGATSACSRSR
jgi:hypothetical protein